MGSDISASEALLATVVAGSARVRHLAHAHLDFSRALTVELTAQQGLLVPFDVRGEALALHSAEDEAPVVDDDPFGDVEPTAAATELEADESGSDEVSWAVEPADEAEDVDDPDTEDHEDVDLSNDLVSDEHPALEDADDERTEYAPAPLLADDDEELLVGPEEDAADDPPEEPALIEESEEDSVEDAEVVPEDDLLEPLEQEDDLSAVLETEERSYHSDDSADEVLAGPPEEEDDDLGDDLDLDDDDGDEDSLVVDDDDELLAGPAAEDEADDQAEDEASVEELDLDEEVLTGPSQNEWEDEDHTVLAESAQPPSDWADEDHTMLAQMDQGHLQEPEEPDDDDVSLGDLLVEAEDTPASTYAEDDDDEDDLLLDEDEDDDDPRSTAAAVRILSDGTAEPVVPEDEVTEDEPSAVVAAGMHEEDEWGEGMATADGGLSLIKKKPKPQEPIPGVPRLTDDDEDDGLDLGGGASADGAVLDLDGGAVQAVEEVDTEQLNAFREAAEDAVAKGDMQLAITHYRDMLDLAPDYVDAYLGRGRCLVHLGDFAAAMSDFQRAEDLDPASAEPLVEMGNLFFSRKDYRRAIEFFNEALELDSKHAWAWCYRGICFHYRKQHKEAFQDLQKAYSLDPEIPNIKRYVQMAVKAMEKS